MLQNIRRRRALPTAFALLLTLLLTLPSSIPAGVLAEESSGFFNHSPNPFEGISRPESASDSGNSESAFDFSRLESVPAPSEFKSAPELTDVWPEPVEGFLPICWRKNTDEKVVALTIDDCNEAGNLKKIISAIAKDGGKATLFPIGENVSFLAPTLRDAVNQGFEIENHTMSHSGLYHENDAEFARQIWQQNYEVSKALGGDYQMHFLRPRGGDNRYDQRTHAYLRQMGYSGIAYWSQDGSHSTARKIMKKLTPGDTILFHTTDEDVKIIQSLIPKLRDEGYRIVTLNELFDLEKNTLSDTVSDGSVMPLVPYERFSQTLHPGDYLRDVYMMQERLSALGYLEAQYNGFFGNTTAKALKAFQQASGLEPDGICGSDTWNSLFPQS